MEKVIEAIFRHMKETPEKEALVYQGETITYREMERYIRAVSEKLSKYQKKDCTIGIMTARSPMQVISILACIRLGLYFIPIDTRFPMERVEEIRKDSAMAAILYDSDAVTFHPDLDQIDVRTLKPKDGPDLPAAEEAGCIYYTSGSTGKPKGIKLAQEFIDECVYGVIDYSDFPEPSHILYNVPVSYLVAMFLILIPLTVGETMYILPDGEEKDVKRMVELINGTPINVCMFVPSLLHYVAGYCKSLGIRLESEIVFAGGEALKTSILREFQTCFDGRVICLYGSTETCGPRMGFRCTEEKELGFLVPTGEPLGDTRYHVLDENKQECEEGELWFAIRKRDVCYMNLPEQNAKTFQKNPFYGTDPAEKEYMVRTGDYVKKTQYGVEYVDRVDRMCKLHGQRIDMNEIEARIKAAAADSVECIVQKENRDNMEYLAAYVKFLEEKTEEEKIRFLADLKEKLSRVLMVYMIPTVYCEVDDWKLNQNGKLDKKALSKIGKRLADFTNEAAYSGSDEVLRKIIGIWTGVLALETIGENSNLFTLGGTSIQAIRIVSDVEIEFGCSVDMRRFLQNPTPQSMKECMQERDTEKQAVEETAEAKATPLMLSYHFSKQGDGGHLPTFSYLEATVPYRGKAYWVDRFGTMVAKYDIFHATMEDDRYLIRPALKITDLPYLDLRNLSEAEREAKQNDFRNQEMNRAVGVNELPGIRLSILREQEDTERLAVYAEGLRLDGYNLLRVVQMLTDSKELPDFPKSFESYLKYDQPKPTEEERNRMQEALSDYPGGAFLPREEENGPEEPKQYLLPIEAGDMDHITAVAKQCGVSVFSVILTTLCNTLAHWQEEADFTVSVPVSRKISHGEEYAPGVYSDFLLYDYHYDAKKSVADAVKETHRNLFLKVNETPVSGIEALRMWQQADPIPVNETRVPIVIGDMTQYEIREDVDYVYNHTVGIQLEINLIQTRGNYKFMVNTTEHAVKEYVLQSFLEALQNAMHRVRADLSYLEQPQPWTLPARDEAVLKESNAHYQWEIPYRPITDTLRRHMEERAHQPAFYYQKQVVSYGALKERIVRYAAFLKEQGVKASDRVMIYSEKSLDQYIAVLSVHFLGAVYVPCDNAFGTDFIRENAERIQVRHVITDKEDKEVLKEYHVLPMYGALEGYTTKEQELPDVPHDPEDLFCIIFTSGSTGVPNAVPIRLGGVYNALMFAVREFEVTDKDTIISLTDLAHDMSLFDLFGLLLAGGSIVIPTEAQRRDPINWLEWMDRYYVSIWNSVPAFMEMLTAYLEEDDTFLFQHMRVMIAGGDYLSVPVLEKLWKMNPSMRMISTGGPTETSLWNICCELKQDDLKDWTVPYGYAIPNTAYYILSTQEEPVPLGVPGRMCADGIGNMSGYLNDKKGAFVTGIPAEYSLLDQGDWGYMDASGLIHFSGRHDWQIKVNGKRMNLVAIETEIMKITGSDSFATVIKPEGQNAIYAYFCAKEPYSSEAIKEELKKHLPDYMIPKEIIRLEEMLLNRSGKIDRKALSKRKIVSSPMEEQPELLDETEERFVAHAAELLGRKTFRSGQNFIASGGDSISMVRMAAWIKQQYGADLLLEDMFEHPDVHSWYEMMKAAKTNA